MNSFDSTFEALALHYVGFGLFTVVNNVWTVIALVTAALSFWRLRASSSLPFPSDHLLESPSPAEAAKNTTVLARPKVTTAAPSACAVDVVTKGRFVTYYREEDEDRDEDEEVEISGDERLFGDKAGEWWEGWEKALSLRSNGDERGKGWYDYQDRAVLSGCVVRLWEEERWSW